MSATKMEFESSFYVTGGTLDHDAACYVTRQSDQQLYDGLRQGQFCYVLTARQMGKSSLMVRTAARLREEGVGVAVLDLTALGQNLTAEQWYSGLLTQMAQQLELEDELDDFWDTHRQIGPLQRWMQAVRRVVLPRYPGPVVIFVDEIDAVRSLPFSTDEFFAGIREFYNLRTEDEEPERLTFCLLGVATPSDLIRDTRTTPFNIGQRIELHDFTDEEAAPLAQGLRQTPEIGAALLKRALRWTGGHPYLTQRLCQAIVEEANASTPGEVDRLCMELFLSEPALERDDNLLFVRERMLRSEVDLAGLLGLYAQVRRGKRVRNDVTNPLISILRLSGITRVDDGYLRVRNRIYERVFDREWVKANMPDAEVRRQREAYRRGVLRATTVAVLIIAMIAGLAFIALQQRNFAKAEAGRADRNFQQASSSAEEARRALAETETHRAIAEQQRQGAIAQQLIAEEQRQRADAQRVRAQGQELSNRRLTYAAQMNLAEQAWDNADIDRMRELLANHLPKPGQEDLRGFEWYYLWRLGNSDLFTLHHRDSIASLAFSPDGAKLAAQAGGRAGALWDVATGRELPLINDLWSGSLVVAFSPDGKLLARGGSGGAVRLWDAATRQAVATLQAPEGQVIRAMAFSPDGKRLATGNAGGVIRLWDVAARKELAAFKGHTGLIYSLAFSPNGEKLATGSADQTVKLWEAGAGRELKTFKWAAVFCVGFSPDGRRLAAGASDGSARLFDVATGKELFVLKGHSQGVMSLAFSPDGSLLATGGFDRVAKLWDVATGQKRAAFKGHGQAIDAIAFTPDGKKLATGGRDRIVKLWDVTTRQEPIALGAEQERIWAVAFSPDGRMLVSGSMTQNARLWDVATGKELLTLKGHVITAEPNATNRLAVAFSPDGGKIATGGADRTIKLWAAATGKELNTLKGHSRAVKSVAFSPDGKLLASGGDDATARLWDAATGRELFTLRGHTFPVEDVAFSPDGKTLATGSSDSTIKLWDTARGRELATFEGHTSSVTSLTYSLDGKTLATGGLDNTVKLWDASTGRELLTLKGHSSGVFSVAFSPDGKRLATGSVDHSVKLWDLITGQEVATLKGHTAQVFSVAFSPDGKSLATGSFDGAVKIWRAATNEEVLARKDRVRFAGTRAVNPDAYEAYLKGRHFGLSKKCIDYFNQAIEKAPDFIHAYVGLVSCYVSRAEWGLHSPREAHPKVKAAAEKAVRLDGSLLEARVALAEVRAFFDWDWPAADREFKRAIEMDPNTARTRYLYASHLANMGRLEEALAQTRRARELDPFSSQINRMEGYILYLARRYDEAIAYLRKILETYPNFSQAYWNIGMAYSQKGMHQEAIYALEKAAEITGDGQGYLGYLGYVYAAAGRRAEALKVLDELRERSQRKYVRPMHTALVYFGLGEKDQTFAWLQKAYDERDNDLVYFIADPISSSLRSDPRFQKLHARMGFPR